MTYFWNLLFRTRTRNETTNENLQALEGLKIVVYYVDWCPHCHKLLKLLNQMCKEPENPAFIKIHVENREMFGYLDAFPTVYAVIDGRVIDRLMFTSKSLTISDLKDFYYKQSYNSKVIKIQEEIRNIRLCLKSIPHDIEQIIVKFILGEEMYGEFPLNYPGFYFQEIEGLFPKNLIGKDKPKLPVNRLYEFFKQN